MYIWYIHFCNQFAISWTGESNRKIYVNVWYTHIHISIHINVNKCKFAYMKYARAILFCNLLHRRTQEKRMYTCVNTYMQIYEYTHIHIYIYVYTYKCEYTHMTCTYICTCIHINVNIHMWYIHGSDRFAISCNPRRTQEKHIRTHVNTHMFTYEYKYVHTYIYMYTYECAYTWMIFSRL